MGLPNIYIFRYNAQKKFLKKISEISQKDLKITEIPFFYIGTCDQTYLDTLMRISLEGQESSKVRL